MPAFGDDLFLGPVQIATRSLGVANPTGNPSEPSIGAGPLGRIYVFDVVPLAANATNVVNAATTAGAGSIPIAAGTNATAYTSAAGPVYVKFDVARCLALSSAANLSAVNFTITGLDQYGQVMTVLIAGPNANTIKTTKAFRAVSSVSVSAAVGTAVNIGTSDTIGLPWALSSAAYIVSRNWNNAADTSTVVAADTTSPATSATGDTRGTLALSSASDGTKRLVFIQALTGIQCGPQATSAGLIGNPQA